MPRLPAFSIQLITVRRLTPYPAASWSTDKVVYSLKTPYRDGTTQVAFDPGGHPPWISLRD
jgi:hypothetical protein